MAQSLGRNQECYVVPESVYGTREGSRPVSTDQVPVISLRTPRNQELLVPQDKTGYRSARQPIAGGAVNGEVSLDVHMYPSGTPGTAPDIDLFLKNLLGAKNTAIATTINDAGVAATDFDLTSVTNVEVGSLLFVGVECRPVSVIASSNVTFAVPFSASPANGATVKGITYKLADPVAEGLDVYNYDGDGNLNRVAEGVVINSGTFQIDTLGRILSLSMAGLAKDISTSAITSKPTGVTVGSPIAASFGQVYIGTTAYSLHNLSIVVDNGDERQQIPVGSQNSPGISRGRRGVSVNFGVYLDGTSYALYADAVARTSKSLLIQIGNTAGYIFGFWIPTFVLNVPDPEFNDGDVIMNLSGVAYGSNTEFFLGHN